jgi:hypothetical protein
MDLSYVYNTDPESFPWGSVDSKDVYGFASEFIQPGTALFFNGQVPYESFNDQAQSSIYLDGDVLIPALFYNKSRLTDPEQVAIGVAITNTVLLSLSMSMLLSFHCCCQCQCCCY